MQFLRFFLFIVLVAIRASGGSTFTCPDLFSLARIIFSKNNLPKFYMPLNLPYTYSCIVHIMTCLYVNADLHFFMEQSRLYSCTFIYLLLILKKKKKKKKKNRISVTRWATLLLVFSRLLSVSRGDRGGGGGGVG